MLIRIAITQDWDAPHKLEWTDRACNGDKDGSNQSINIEHKEAMNFIDSTLFI
jgi:hypothetical protein